MAVIPCKRQQLFSLWLVARVAGALLAVIVVAIAVLLACENRIIYHPVPASQRWLEPPPGFTSQDVELQTADGTPIHARWFPHAGATGAVLVCHGQAGNVSLECPAPFLAGWQANIGVSVLLFDYPGYGRSGGDASEAGCYAAADAAYDWLMGTSQVPPAQLLIYGRSLGTGVAVDLASRRAHRALILVAPYTSLPDIAARRFGLLPAPLLMRNQFPCRAKIGECTQPLFVMHGTNDHVVPFALGKALFDAAHEPKRFVSVEGGRHGGALAPDFFHAVRHFLHEVQTGASPQ